MIIAGNWKMHKTGQEAANYIEMLAPLLKESQVEVLLAVPFTAIETAAKAAEGTPIVVGAQNMNDASEGAFTGEIAVSMLREAGAQFVLLGHSERRHIFHETNLFINKKVKKALAGGIRPLLCIGETYEERESGRAEEVLDEQLNESLREVDDLQDLILAYEPVWAIGTGHTATPEMAEERHAYLRERIGDQLILYGGSVKPANAGELVAQLNIDGLLVGGASLDPETFSQVVQSCKSSIT